MSASINSEQIVTKMITNWGYGDCVFGYPQHVDEIHKKLLPLMIINPPEMSIATNDFNRNTILTNSNWVFTTYQKENTSYKSEFGDELILNSQSWDGASGTTPPNNWTNESLPLGGLKCQIVGTNKSYKQSFSTSLPSEKMIITQQINVEIGKTYRFEYNDIDGDINSTIKLGYNGIGSSEILNINGYNGTSGTLDFLATDNNVDITLTTQGELGTEFLEINNLSLKKINLNVELLKQWDDLEDQVLTWFEKWWYSFEDDGNDFNLTTPIQITRLKEASNDRLIGLKVTFSFNFFRFCNRYH
jgi:hypothetical protein